MLRQTGPARERFAYTGQDAIGVASYQVAHRTAAPSAKLRRWTTPPAWRATTATAVRRRVRPGAQVCFRVRARDHAGQTSRWSRPRCSAAPYDDTALTPRGRIPTRHRARALGGSESVLRRDASLHRRRLTGRTVAVLTTRGPRQGALKVFVNGRRIRRVDLRAPRRHRTVVTVRAPRRWRGTVRLTATNRRPVRVDGLAVLR